MAGAAALGALLVGWLAQLLSRVLTAQKLPPLLLQIVQPGARRDRCPEGNTVCRRSGTESVLRYRGRAIEPDDVRCIRALIAARPEASRRALSIELCRAWGWVQDNGALRDADTQGRPRPP